MGDLTVDLDDDVIRRLEREAAAHGWSVEDEHRAILEQELCGREVSSPAYRSAWAEHARKLRQLTAGQALVPSEDLIREARDER